MKKLAVKTAKTQTPAKEFVPATSRQIFMLWCQDKTQDWKWMGLSKTDASAKIDEFMKAKQVIQKGKFKVNGLAANQGSSVEQAMEIVAQLIKSGVLTVAQQVV